MPKIRLQHFMIFFLENFDIISDISDHFYDFGIFDDMRLNSTHHAF